MHTSSIISFICTQSKCKYHYRLICILIQISCILKSLVLRGSGCPHLDFEDINRKNPSRQKATSCLVGFLLDEQSHVHSRMNPHTMTMLKCVCVKHRPHLCIYIFGLTLAHKLIRSGYYWPNMEQDSIKYARAYKQCQLHGNLIDAPARELIPSISMWPFQQCAFDLVGLIHPSSSNGHKFIIIATNYFKKWVEAVPLSITNGKFVALFITNYIICRYGVPSSIITDNGGQFKNKDLKELCKKFRITQHWSSIYYPQGNGQEEASNKAILKILHHTVSKSRRDYHLQINLALWVDQTSIITPTGAMPFTLVYGADVVLPIEVKIPTL